MHLNDARVVSDADVGTDAFVRPASEASGAIPNPEPRKPEAEPQRLLAVTQFFEEDDMAFVLDRMLSSQNPMRARLVSGRYFVRFVVIEDQTQRRSICNALNQWMVTAAEKATGIGSHFATSLELTPATEYVPADEDIRVARAPSPASVPPLSAPQLDSGAAADIRRTNPFPSGF